MRTEACCGLNIQCCQPRLKAIGCQVNPICKSTQEVQENNKSTRTLCHGRRLFWRLQNYRPDADRCHSSSWGEHAPCNTGLGTGS